MVRCVKLASMISFALFAVLIICGVKVVNGFCRSILVFRLGSFLIIELGFYRYKFSRKTRLWWIEFEYKVD